MFEIARVVSTGCALAALGTAAATARASTIVDEARITAATVIGARGLPRQTSKRCCHTPDRFETRLQSCRAVSIEWRNASGIGLRARSTWRPAAVQRRSSALEAG